MTPSTRTTDRKARVRLPKAFANRTLIIERVSDTELRIRKAPVTPGDEVRFAEESATTLSDRDRDRFLALLDEPPRPNEALKKAAGKHKRHIRRAGWGSGPTATAGTKK
jgi:Protein of unknown function (DUF1778)